MNTQVCIYTTITQTIQRNDEYLLFKIFELRAKSKILLSIMQVYCFYTGLYIVSDILFSNTFYTNFLHFVKEPFTLFHRTANHSYFCSVLTTNLLPLVFTSCIDITYHWEISLITFVSPYNQLSALKLTSHHAFLMDKICSRWRNEATAHLLDQVNNYVHMV